MSPAPSRVTRVHVCDCGHAEPRDGAPGICPACGVVASLSRARAGVREVDGQRDGRPRVACNLTDPSCGARILPMRGAE